jgi:hypothetical protein
MLTGFVSIVKSGTAQHIQAYISFTGCTDAHILGHVSLVMSSLQSTEHTRWSVFILSIKTDTNLFTDTPKITFLTIKLFSIILCRIRQRQTVSDIFLISQAMPTNCF